MIEIEKMIGKTIFIPASSKEKIRAVVSIGMASVARCNILEELGFVRQPGPTDELGEIKGVEVVTKEGVGELTISFQVKRPRKKKAEIVRLKYSEVIFIE